MVDTSGTQLIAILLFILRITMVQENSRSLQYRTDLHAGSPQLHADCISAYLYAYCIEKIAKCRDRVHLMAYSNFSGTETTNLLINLLMLLVLLYVIKLIFACKLGLYERIKHKVCKFPFNLSNVGIYYS